MTFKITITYGRLGDVEQEAIKYLHNMHRSLVSKSEGRYDVRAPLATFDTIDLGEDIAFIHSSSSANDESVSESGDETNKAEIVKKRQLFGKHASPKFERSDSHVYEKLGEGSAGNNLKDSRPETSECMNQRPSPDDSFSDSSDSDSGYIQSGYLSMTDGRVTKHDFQSKIPTSPFSTRYSRVPDHDISQENTPTSSPQLARSPLPVLLHELETVKVESKRKALERRIQRLQVTTRPVERPRSTTPINVVTLDEYKVISSPEKYQTPDHLEKLKIKLPAEDVSYSRQRSPRKSRGSVSESFNVFSFNEEHLFTHTKSAFLLQNDGSVGQSPKRIFIPPSLSPAMSPAASPIKSAVISSTPPITASQKFYYNPTLKSQTESSPRHQPSVVTNLVRNNWIAFEDNLGPSNHNHPAKNNSVTESAKDTDTKLSCVQTATNSESEISNDSAIKTNSTVDVKFNIPRIIEHAVCESECEEILTINIEEFNNGTKICNINVSQSLIKEIPSETADNVCASTEAVVTSDETVKVTDIPGETVILTNTGVPPKEGVKYGDTSKVTPEDGVKFTDTGITTQDGVNYQLTDKRIAPHLEEKVKLNDTGVPPQEGITFTDTGVTVTPQEWGKFMDPGVTPEEGVKRDDSVTEYRRVGVVMNDGPTNLGVAPVNESTNASSTTDLQSNILVYKEGLSCTKNQSEDLPATASPTLTHVNGEPIIQRASPVEQRTSTFIDSTISTDIASIPNPVVHETDNIAYPPSSVDCLTDDTSPPNPTCSLVGHHQTDAVATPPSFVDCHVDDTAPLPAHNPADMDRQLTDNKTYHPSPDCHITEITHL